MTIIDRFRQWYDYECDSNAKALAMLDSVPIESRAKPEYAKALAKMGHLAIARKMWLFRLGHGEAAKNPFPEINGVEEIRELLSPVEAAWKSYLQTLTEADLAREFEYIGWDKKNYRWTVEGVLTQTFGHAWYHRAQIATLVASLGGKAMDTDYVLWSGSGRVCMS
jgi:uncharacterized damage-inducible protein DinB